MEGRDDRAAAAKVEDHLYPDVLREADLLLEEPSAVAGLSAGSR
jgi:hypothetical protein